VVDESSAALWICELTAVRYANPQAAAITGYSQEELSSMEFWNIIHPDHQAMFHDMRARRRSGEDIPNPIEYKLLTKQGEVRWADFSVAGPVDFFWGPGFVVSAVDATNRKRAEEIISLRNPQLESLFDIAGILAGVASESEKYSSVMNRLVEMVSGDAGTIRILDESTESLVRLAVSELWLDELPVDHRSHSAIASQAFRTGQPVVVNDYLALDRANPALVRAEIQSVAAIPIWSGARKLGVVTVCSMSPNFFGREEIAMLTAVVEGLGVLMEKSRLAGQLLRSSQENKIVDELALTMTSNLDMDQVYEQFTTEANKLVKFDRAAINVIDGGRNSLVVKCLVGSGVPGMEAGTVFPLDGTFTQLVAELGDTIMRDYPVWDDPYWETKRYFADSGLLSAICIPLFAQGSVIASFTFRSKEPGAFNHNDRTVLERLCTYIGPALANSELYQRTRDTEDALRESNTQLQRTLANLEEAQDQIVQRERMEALGSMSSGIAHDFNNALTPIIGYAELLLNQPNVLDDQETATRYVRRIHTVAARAAELVRSIREFYRPRDGNQVFGAVDLNATVLREIENTEPVWRRDGPATEGGINIRTNLAHGRPIAYGSEGDLARVISNLIINAIDAMPMGGTLTISTGFSGRMAEFRVTDTGIGMSEEVRRRAEEPFFTTKGDEGSGLGLAIVHGIVERHLGELTIESIAGAGSTFTIRLPMGDAGPQLEEPEEESGAIGGLHILVADDDEMVRKLIAEYLISADNTVETASNGREALEMWHAGSFDLVITDRRMPELNGDQFASTIEDMSPGFPVIMLTGYGDMMHDIRESPRGVDLVISKPVSRDKFLQEVSRLMKRN
tara:strand:+ start:3926 stop:6475 length:2550 start_codon:yes stop_codon:yes gene_type:complete